MQLTELDELITRVIVDSDHPEIASVERVPTSEQPDDHTRVKVTFANGGAAIVMVHSVSGPGVSNHSKYEPPREVV